MSAKAFACFLSNWTELDIWQYIFIVEHPRGAAVFCQAAPGVVVRDGMIMLVDDDRCRLLPGEIIQNLKVRFRTLGCYPLTGAVESEAETLEDTLFWSWSTPAALSVRGAARSIQMPPPVWKETGVATSMARQELAQ